MPGFLSIVVYCGSGGTGHQSSDGDYERARRSWQCAVQLKQRLLRICILVSEQLVAADSEPAGVAGREEWICPRMERYTPYLKDAAGQGV